MDFYFYKKYLFNIFHIILEQGRRNAFYTLCSLFSISAQGSLQNANLNQPPSFKQELKDIDLSSQFSLQTHEQSANTCFLHASTGLISAAFYRAGHRVQIDDSLIAAQYTQQVLNSQNNFEPKSWLSVSRSIVGQNIYYFKRGKIKSIVDFGMLNKELLSFLLESKIAFNLTPKQEDQKQIIINNWKAFHQVVLSESQSLQNEPPPPYPFPELSSEEILAWSAMKKSIQTLEEFFKPIAGQLTQIQPQANFEKLLGYKLRPLDIEFKYDIKSSQIQQIYEDLRLLPQDPNQKNNLEKQQEVCNQASLNLQNEMSWYLKQGIPLAVGLQPGGMLFGPDQDHLQPVYKTNTHAMILQGIKGINGKFYFVFKDSGYVPGSHLALMPLEETCRVLNAVALIGPSDLRNFAGTHPPRKASPESFPLAEAQKNALKKNISIQSGYPLVSILSLWNDLNNINSNYFYINRCTGFLTTPTTVLTASHCVPKEVIQSPSLCRDQIFITGLNQNNQKKTTVCKSLKFASETHWDPLDYPSDVAIIEMDQPISMKSYFTLDYESQSSDANYRVESFDPEANNSVFRSQQCSLVFNNYILPTFIHPDQPRWMLGDCKSSGGNSGSPVINSKNGYVVAVLDSTHSTSELSELTDLWKSRNLLLENPRPLSSASRLACISSQPSKSQLCQTGYGRRSIINLQRKMIYENPDIKLAKEKLETESQTMTSHDSLIQWQVETIDRTDDFSSLISFTPSCLKLSQGRNFDLRNHNQLNSISAPIHAEKYNDQFTRQLNIYSYRLGFDKFLRFQVILEKNKDGEGLGLLTHSQSLNSGSWRFSLTQGSKLLYNSDVSLCDQSLQE